MVLGGFLVWVIVRAGPFAESLAGSSSNEVWILGSPSGGIPDGFVTITLGAAIAFFGAQIQFAAQPTPGLRTLRPLTLGCAIAALVWLIAVRVHMDNELQRAIEGTGETDLGAVFAASAIRLNMGVGFYLTGLGAVAALIGATQLSRDAAWVE